MTRDEKIQFVMDVTSGLLVSIVEKIDKMPKEWDGRELRQYVADKVAENVNYLPMEKHRRRAYENEILTRNL